MGLFTNRKQDEADNDVAGLEQAAGPLAQFDSSPRRRLEDQPRARAGNVEIDRDGLLTLLGVGPDATLLDISEAHQRFVADHQPISTDDDDAAQIKKRIRHEANSAYASFRLTHSN